MCCGLAGWAIVTLSHQPAVACPGPPQISAVSTTPMCARRLLVIIVVAKEKERHEVRAVKVTMWYTTSLPGPTCTQGDRVHGLVPYQSPPPPPSW
ncbi:hypothetical protein F5X98DRAFT_332366 [Xylaria grammica]|nr:hypothetical protein F5X98DRAFT_332366 [Xylaria grammica]